MSEPEEKRIYVVVAEKVKANDEYVAEVVQPAGRIAAQVAHAVSKVRVNEIAADVRRAPYFVPVTTIVLATKDSAELDHIGVTLVLGDIDHETFEDTNVEYGYDDNHQLLKVMTAIATYPIEPSKVQGLLSHLPLWSPCQ